MLFVVSQILQVLFNSLIMSVFMSAIEVWAVRIRINTLNVKTSFVVVQEDLVTLRMSYIYQ